ncbi:uncharacterized protein LOC128883733 isoform X2 [Hylaeus volcanicus]|uniref:uncharacterized protein LOC128883733 isoform X2 n=1 Tax=Hylaeus volcanicus TaxID=313075 RepID=UPI0023B84C82|nr:uncharacterized protein LOC128883733 isoform X2 [Hylaeus volcanicus]
MMLPDHHKDPRQLRNFSPSMHQTAIFRPHTPPQANPQTLPSGSMQLKSYMRPSQSIQMNASSPPVTSLRPMTSMRPMGSIQPNSLTRLNGTMQQNVSQRPTGVIQPNVSVRYNGPLRPNSSPRPNASMQRTFSMRPMVPHPPLPASQSIESFRPVVDSGPPTFPRQGSSMNISSSIPRPPATQQSPSFQETSVFPKTQSIEKKNVPLPGHAINKKLSSTFDRLPPKNVMVSQMAARRNSEEVLSYNPLQHSMVMKSSAITRSSPVNDPRNQIQQNKHANNPSIMQNHNMMGKLPPMPPMNQPTSRKADAANLFPIQRRSSQIEYSPNLMSNFSNLNTPKNSETPNQSKHTPFSSNSPMTPKVQQTPIVQKKVETSENKKKYTSNSSYDNVNNTQAADVLKGKSLSLANHTERHVPMHAAQSNLVEKNPVNLSQEKIFSDFSHTPKHGAVLHPNVQSQQKPYELTQSTREHPLNVRNSTNESSYLEDGLRNTNPPNEENKEFHYSQGNSKDPQEKLKVDELSHAPKAIQKEFGLPQLPQSSETSGLTSQVTKKLPVSQSPHPNVSTEVLSYNKQSDQLLHQNNSHILTEKSFLKQMPPLKNTTDYNKQNFKAQLGPTSTEKFKSLGSSLLPNKGAIEISKPSESHKILPSIHDDSLPKSNPNSRKFANNANLMKPTNVKPSISSTFQKSSVPSKLKTEYAESIPRPLTIETKSSNNSSNRFINQSNSSDMKKNLFKHHSGSSLMNKEAKLYDVNANMNSHISRGVQTYECSRDDERPIHLYSDLSENLVGMPCINQLCMLTKNNKSKLMCIQDSCVHNCDGNLLTLPKLSKKKPIHSSCFALQAANNRHLCINGDMNMYELFNDCLLPRKSIYVDPQKLLCWTSRVPFTLRETYLYEDLTKGFNDYWEEIR